MLEPPDGPWVDPELLQREAVEKLVEIETKLVSAIYDKAVAYTNLVVAAGYAAFFGLWAITKPYASPGLLQWAALLMLASAATFVIFEIYKMWRTTQDLNSRYFRLGQMIEGKSAVELLAMYRRTGLEAQQSALALVPKWRIALGVSATTGLAAVLLLGAALLIGVFKGAV
ncbi:hypothetical protein [Usitatibacter palustris]|uniref:hypothetical protein n=1 Tax=Usitatibacter palustris TaxID=2732487 RepID=UPI001488F687|nr:hypothetical protein [Usitatibacter palustris]